MFEIAQGYFTGVARTYLVSGRKVALNKEGNNGIRPIGIQHPFINCIADRKVAKNILPREQLISYTLTIIILSL